MADSHVQRIILAGGCFWGVQYYLDQVPGIVETVVGYTGGHTINPTYEQVCSHTTGHAEAVLVVFDPLVLPLEKLLQHFFRLHDPTQLNRQGPDIGDSYRSAIFYLDEAQKPVAIAAMHEAAHELSEPIVTEITAASEFYVAEEYHQKFAERTGRGMCHVPYKEL